MAPLSHLRWSVVTKERQQIASFHQLEQDKVGIRVEAEAQKSENVIVFEVAHEERLFEEFTLLLIRRSFAQSL